MKIRFKVLIAVGSVILLGLLISESRSIPVDGASQSDWNENSFWYEPWGTSGVHKGIDIFSKPGRNVISGTGGLVLYTGMLKKGGNVVVILGPKWRIHYYAHLHSVAEGARGYISIKEKIGTVGNTGNAKGKPAHLHYSIVSLLPHFWLITLDTQGWKRMFYLNPEGHI